MREESTGRLQRMPADVPMRPGGCRRAAFWPLLIAVIAFNTGLSAATVELDVGGVQVGSGAVLASLCEDGLDRASCGRGQSRSADAAVLTFVFPDVSPGRYAALAFQDVYGDGVLRRSRMGRPLEPFALSNGVGRSRRPTFEQAAVRVGPSGARIDIHLDRLGSP